LEKSSFTIKNIGNKSIYNIDNNISGSDWVRRKLKNINLIECVQLSSFNKPKQSNENRIVPNSLGYLLIQSNNIRANNLQVAILSSASSNRGGVSIIKEIFLIRLVFLQQENPYREIG
jgi:hypothetical protein